MYDPNKYFGEFEGSLHLVLSNLNELNDSNFDSKMGNIKSLIIEIEKKRVFIKNNFGEDVLSEKRDLVHRVVKQIRGKFDDVIEERKEKQNLISSELNELSNKKKLINYQR